LNREVLIAEHILRKSVDIYYYLLSLSGISAWTFTAIIDWKDGLYLLFWKEVFRYAFSVYRVVPNGMSPNIFLEKIMQIAENEIIIDSSLFFYE